MKEIISKELLSEVIGENPYIKELSYTWEQTEPKAIFKACQWILDNKDKQ